MIQLGFDSVMCTFHSIQHPTRTYAFTANLRTGKALVFLNCLDVLVDDSVLVRARRIARVLFERRSKGLYFLFCKMSRMFSFSRAVYSQANLLPYTVYVSSPSASGS